MQKKLFNRYFILVWFGSLCLLLIHNILNNGIPLYLDSIGFSTSFSGLLGVPFALLGIVGRMLGGYLVDRRGRRMVMVGGTLLMGVAAFLLGLLPLAATMLLFRALTGVGFSSAQAAYSTASVDVTPPGEDQPGGGHLLGRHGPVGGLRRLHHPGPQRRGQLPPGVRHLPDSGGAGCPAEPAVQL